MQKLITLTIDIGKLQEQSSGPFAITEIDAITELVSAGWVVESWEFVTGEEERTKAVILMMLNDGMDGVAYEDPFYEMEDEEAGEYDAHEPEDDETPSGNDASAHNENR